MRDVQWLYQLLGKAYAENAILREELDKAQAELAKAIAPSPVVKEAKA
jgi:hypothetical protein